MLVRPHQRTTSRGAFRANRAALAGVLALGLLASACGGRFTDEELMAALPGGGGPGAPAEPAAPPPVSGPDARAPRTLEAPAGPGTDARVERTIQRVVGADAAVIEGGEIRIGGLFPLSGGLSAMGRPAWQGADAYFRWVNDQGGVGGHTFRFIACDDQASDTQSTTCAKKLVEQDRVFVMGPSFTPFSLTVIRQLEQMGVPWLGYDGINIEGFDAPNVVTVGAPIETMAHALLPAWYRTIERETGVAPQRIGAVTLDEAPAATYVREAREVICPALGCEIVRDQRVTYTTTEYGSICRTMQNQRVDAIWVVTDPASAIKLLVQCQSIGYRPPAGFLGQHGIYLDLTLEQAGRIAEGMFANGAVLPESVEAPATEEMKRIIETYHPDASFGYWTALSFASARMLVDLVSDVLERGETLTRSAILEAAGRFGSYDCGGLCANVNLAPPARGSGGNHNIWLVRADFSDGDGRWAYEAGPIDAFQAETWRCPGRPC